MSAPAKSSKKLGLFFSLFFTALILGGTLYAAIASSKEPTVELADSALVIKHFYGMRIDRSAIIGVECLTAPVKITGRTFGTAAGSARTGDFNTAEYGIVRLYIYGNRLDGSQPYTIIFTENKPIIIAFADEARTREVYSHINEWLTQHED